eukprot:9485673-Pyramimonas_sp.AAC.1
MPAFTNKSALKKTSAMSLMCWTPPPDARLTLCDCRPISVFISVMAELWESSNGRTMQSMRSRALRDPLHARISVHRWTVFSQRPLSLSKLPPPLPLTARFFGAISAFPAEPPVWSTEGGNGGSRIEPLGSRGPMARPGVRHGSRRMARIACLSKFT